MSKTAALTVKCCADCPFFGGVPLLSALSEALSGSDGHLAKAGTCNFDRDTSTVIRVPLGVVGPERDAMKKSLERRMLVTDKTTIPEKCPLRERDVVVTLGS